MNGKKDTAFAALYELSSIGIFLVVATFVGGGLGYFLDTQVFDTFPWISAAGLILGIITGFRRIFQLAGSAADRDPDKNPDKDNENGSDRQDR